MKKHTSFYRCAMRYGSLAAVFVLGVTVLWQANQISSLKENQAAAPPENGKVSVFTETEASETDIQNADTNAVRDTDSEKATIMDTNQSGQNAAETSNNINVSKSSAAASAPQEDAFTYADSYEQIYDTLKDKLGISLYGRDSAYDVHAEGTSDTGVSTASSADSAASSDVQNTSDFSETNLQEAGVDEGDIVKTDGQYLYILKQDLSFSIIRADGSDLTLCSTTPLDTSALSNPSIKELYLDGTQLTVLFQGTQSSLEQEDNIYYTSSSMASVL